MDAGPLPAILLVSAGASDERSRAVVVTPFGGGALATAGTMFFVCRLVSGERLRLLVFSPVSGDAGAASIGILFIDGPLSNARSRAPLMESMVGGPAAT